MHVTMLDTARHILAGATVVVGIVILLVVATRSEASGVTVGHIFGGVCVVVGGLRLAALRTGRRRGAGR
jgi:protein-S-isoprenylcysteine O-methyltransferase Ste14